MAATVYERNNCHGDLLLQQIIVSCLLQKIVHIFVSDQTCSIIIKALSLIRALTRGPYDVRY